MIQSHMSVFKSVSIAEMRRDVDLNDEFMWSPLFQ